MEKPGYKKLSFWGTVLAFVAALVMALTDTGGAIGQGAAAVGAMLAAAGYAVARGAIKLRTGANAKPWYKQTEFYLSILAVVVGLLIQGDFFADQGTVGKALAGLATILATLGYGAGLKRQKPPSPSGDMITGDLR